MAIKLKELENNTNSLMMIDGTSLDVILCDKKLEEHFL